MPYIDEASREEIREKGIEGIRTWGDVNYFITLRILEIWRFNKRYATIHELARRCTVVFDMLTEEEERWILGHFSDGSYTDLVKGIKAAHVNAYLEFYIRVGRKYEDKAIAKNGDVYTAEDLA